MLFARVWMCLLLAVMAGSAPCHADPATVQSSQTSPLQSFELVDCHGRTWSAEDFAEKSVLVLAFLGTECPLAQHYSIRLQEIADRFAGRDVAVVGVMSNRQDSLEEIASFVERQSLSYPVLKDTGNRVADQVGAERTPEVFVFDRDRQLQYRGRIDDQYEIGYTRDEANRHELVTALNEVLAGKPVATPHTPAIGCLIGRAKEVDQEAEITYGSHVAEILTRRCVECHREGEIGPFALTDYDEVAGWSDMIAEVVEEGRMPPWHATDDHAQFENDRRLSPAEREAIFAWAAAGAPAGDLSALPPLPPKVPGWRLPKEPDVVFNLSPEPFSVPATGKIEYQHFVVDPGFSEDKWIRAFEIIPGNREVVHHVLGFAVDPGQTVVGLQAAQGFKFGFVPGTRFTTAPEGYAMRIPAGAHLLFQVHYIAVGEPQTDQSKIGLVFADPDEVTHEVLVGSALEVNLRIPPGDPGYVVHAASPAFPPDAELLSMNPHMHYRGKSMRYDLVTPDGKRETLLDVPNYDFNWQTLYVLQQPLSVPSGSVLEVEAVFDNSAENLYNPDPSKWVYFGDQTWNEMMIGYYFFSVPRGRTESGFTRAELFQKNQMRSTLLMFFDLVDRDGDGKVAKQDLSGPLALIFSQFDADKDGELTTAEVQQGEIPVLMEIILANLMR